MLEIDLVQNPYNINTAGSPSGFSGTSTITGTSVFPTAVADKSFQASFKNSSSSSANITFYCAWEDHIPLTEYFLSANNQTVGYYEIYLGAAHPIYDLFVDDVQIEPFEQNTGLLEWKYAKLHVSYAPRTFDSASPAVIREESLEISGQVISLPAPGLTISGTPTGVPYSVYYPLERYSVTIMRVLSLPLNNVLTCMNTVNSTTLSVQLGGGNVQTVSPGYALYEGIGQVKRTITTGGLGLWDITHTWLISPIKFNLVLNPNAITGSVPITTPMGTTPSVFVQPDQTLYQSKDHASLLGV